MLQIKKIFPDFDGISACDGAIRFYDEDDYSWVDAWGKSYGPLMPEITIFASDVFGCVYGRDSRQRIVIFWSETAEIEQVDVEEEDFYLLIKQDPNNTINHDLYCQAVQRYGKLSMDQNFAFKLETALGGKVEIDNIAKMDKIKHMRSLGQIAQQIHDVPIGTRFIIDKDI